MDTCILTPRNRAGCLIAPLPDQIDATNAARVQQSLLFLLTRRVSVLVADGSGTTFCDAAGARALLRAAQAASGRPADFRLVAASRGMRRILALTGADQILQLYPDLAAALSGSQPSSSESAMAAEETVAEGGSLLPVPY